MDPHSLYSHDAQHRSRSPQSFTQPSPRSNRGEVTITLMSTLLLTPNRSSDLNPRAQEAATEEYQELRAMRQRVVAQLRPGGASAPATDAEEEAAEVLAELKVAQARAQRKALLPSLHRTLTLSPMF